MSPDHSSIEELRNRLPGVRALVGVVLLVGVTAIGAAEPAPNARLAAYFEREYQYQLRESPEMATFDGVAEYNDRLSDLSPAAIARHKAHARDVIAALVGFDVRTLNRQDRISRELMLADLWLDQEVNALYGSLPFDGLGGWLFVSPRGGPQQSFASLVKATPFTSARDYENYLSRLAALPTQLDQVIALMREGMRSRWMPPRAIMDRVVAQFDDFTRSDLAGNLLVRPFANMPSAIPEADRARLEESGRRILTATVVPAFAKLQRFIADEYLPACTDALSVASLPGGDAYYAIAVKRATTTRMTPRQVNELGLREVARIGAQMDRLIGDIGFTGKRGAFFDAIRKDPKFYYTEPDEMLRDYRDIAKRVDAELPKLFAELPRLPYGIRAMEAYEGDNAEHYTPGALDGSRAGFFEANILSLKTRPKYDMENTFLHEAVPGHHLQGARALELKGLPRFRQNGWYVAYGEGWALYAESLGPALGMYKDPYSRFSALSWEMVRACRLVIDTGLHAFGWTRAQSIAYMMENTGLQEAFATAEVDRYIAIPGQALGYKIGELKIKELRDRAQQALGARFDLRRFHNAILDDGAVPMTVLEGNIDRWIASQNQPATKAVDRSVR